MGCFFVRILDKYPVGIYSVNITLSMKAGGFDRGKICFGKSGANEVGNTFPRLNLKNLKR